jgi:hypothetical protein
MRKTTGVLLSLFITFSAFLATTMTLSASAASDNSQDGLTVTIVTDKESYTANEDINLSATVQNTNTYSVDNVSIEILLPTGLTHRSGVLTKDTMSLRGGESLTVSAVAVSETPPSMSPSSNSSTPITPVHQKVIKSPKTDNGLDILLLITLFIVSVVGAVIAFKFRRRAIKIISIFMCGVILSGIVPHYTFARENNNIQKKLEVKKAVQVGEKEYHTKVVVNYSTNTSDQPIVSDDAYNKGEWVTLLSEKIGISTATIEESDYFYGDSHSSEYGLIVETAKRYGLLPTPDSAGYEDPLQDIPLFEADKPATREFVAYTIAKAMGFEGDYAIECNDWSTLTYQSEVSVIVSQGFLTLIEDNFLPNAVLNDTDKNMIFERIDYYNSSLEVDTTNLKDDITFNEGVLQLTDANYSIAENEDETFTVTLSQNTDSYNITQGKVFLLPPNSDYPGGIALSAVSVNSIDNSVIVSCVKPQIEEVLTDFNFIGYGEADISNMTVADGVTASYDPNGVIVSENDDTLAPFDLGGSITLPGKLTYNLDGKKIGDTGITLTGGFEVAIPNITAKAKGKILGGFSLDELTVSVSSKFKVAGRVEYDFGIPENSFDVTTGNPKLGSGKTELGRIPIALGATGLTFDFVIFVKIDVSGKAEISYTLSSTNGFQYKDRAFRTIKDYSTEFNAVELNGTARLGLGLAARITLLSVFELAGIDIHGGIGVTVKFIPHVNVEPNLYCGDGSIYLYATMELDDDTLIVSAINNFIKGKIAWEIFDEDTSPLRLNLHFENGKKVSECSFGKGHILGLVKDAETGEPITGARVKIYNAITNKLEQSKYTQSNPLTLPWGQLNTGEFLAENLTVGTYRLEVAATGYQAYSINLDVIDGQRIVCEAALMVMRNGISGLGSVQGLMTNALTGESLTDVAYFVRKDWNSLSGLIIAQGVTPSVSYEAELEPGNYTLEFKKDGFVPVSANVVIRSNEVTYKDIAITPTSGIQMSDNSFRVVLTWGESPYDLDSHLYGYDVNSNDVFHTSFYDQNYYIVDEDGNRVILANLDLDDTTSYGPETSTVYMMTEDGKYSFYIHDYSNRDSHTSSAMSNSRAQVKLYSAQVLVATFNIPENREGTLWHVFDYDAATDTFSYVNELTYSLYG